MTQADLLRYVVDAFEDLAITYMISGSQASIYYGEPRLTQDIDIVADLTVDHVSGLLARFPFPEFYLAEVAIRDAISTRGQFNIIHPESGLKVDVIAHKDTPYDLVEFSRRQRLPALEEREAYFARPEDVVRMRIVTPNACHRGPAPVNSSLWAASLALPMPGVNTRSLGGAHRARKGSAAENLSPWEREHRTRGMPKGRWWAEEGARPRVSERGGAENARYVA